MSAAGQVPNTEVLVTSWFAVGVRAIVLLIVMLLCAWRTNILLASCAIGGVLVVGLPRFVRSVVFDDDGFQLVRLAPFLRPTVVAWRDVLAFDVYVPHRGRFAVVGYWRRGVKARWWYLAGWPARRTITPTLSWRPDEPPLPAQELRDLLEERRRRAITIPGL